MAAKEKSTTTDVSKEATPSKSEDLTFRNNAIERISALQKENIRLKDMVGRKKVTLQKRKTSGAGTVAGLKTLGSQPSLPG